MNALTQGYEGVMEALVGQWQKEKLQLNPGATESELNTLEMAYGFSLPEDFRHFYALVNGMRDLDMDRHLFSLWPIERIVEYKAAHNESSLDHGIADIPFGDFLISSHRYVLVLDEAGNSCVWAQGIAELSRGFGAFIHRYVNDPEKLYLM